MIQSIKIVKREITGGMEQIGAMGRRVPDRVEETLMVKVNDQWKEVRTEWKEAISFKDYDESVETPS